MFLELAFEMIREAGVRIPGSLGNAIGIVGGLIVGQAAVDCQSGQPYCGDDRGADSAGRHGDPQTRNLPSAFRPSEIYVFFFWGDIWEFFGIVLGLYLTVAHLAGLLSFGMPYLMPFIKKERKFPAPGKEF